MKFGRVWRRLYRRATKSSIFCERDQMHMCSLHAGVLLDKTLELLHPKTVLDLGCGTGQSLNYLMSKGIDVVGIEGSQTAIELAQHPERIRQADLRKPLSLGRTFDLVWCYEVVEHIHAKYVDNLLRTFSAHGDTIVLSAAPPGQGGEGHFNEQPPQYWIEEFGRFGYALDEGITQQLRDVNSGFCANMLVFRRRPADVQ